MSGFDNNFYSIGEDYKVQTTHILCNVCSKRYASNTDYKDKYRKYAFICSNCEKLSPNKRNKKYLKDGFRN